MNRYDVRIELTGTIEANDIDADDNEIAEDKALELLLLHYYDDPAAFRCYIKNIEATLTEENIEE